MPSNNRAPSRTALVATLAAVLTVVVVAALLWPFGPPAANGRADPEDAARVALGKGLYRDYCASCHGAALEGQADWQIRNAEGRLPAPPHDETGHTWHHPDAHLFRITEHGIRPPLAPEGYESDMPAFGETLASEEIWSVLSFIKSAWPEDARAYQDRIDRNFREQQGAP